MASRSRYIAVSTATGYGVHIREAGVRVPVVAGLFSAPRCPDRFWGPPSLLSNGHLGLFPGSKAVRT
jgi:hypothetical protein